jgi:cobalt-zinc-cadmium efflux system protein
MHSEHKNEEHNHTTATRMGNRKRLTLVLVLVTAYMLAEGLGGLWTNSLALLADAGHMLSDVAALALSLFAMWMAQKPATQQRTYGYYRAEILAALANAATLIAIAIFISVEAVQRLQAPPDVQGGWMMVIAVGGLLVNLLGLVLLGKDSSGSLNMRGAWLHMLSDTLGSVGAILAGALISAFQWHWVDPVTSILISVLVLASSWGLLKETVAVLMESAPGHINVDAVHQAIRVLPGVHSVHDLHIWTITSGLIALSAHVRTEERLQHELLREVRKVLSEQFGISHSTIQIEHEEQENEPNCR